LCYRNVIVEGESPAARLHRESRRQRLAIASSSIFDNEMTGKCHPSDGARAGNIRWLIYTPCSSGVWLGCLACGAKIDLTLEIENISRAIFRSRVHRFDPETPVVPSRKIIMNVALLLSCSSFEGFFGRVQGQSRQSYIESYRNDWAWYYGRGLLENGIKPTIYIPALYEAGKYETDVGIPVRFLSLERWYRAFEWELRKGLSLKRLSRVTRWSLYAEERINTTAFMPSLREALAEDDIDLLYIQEHWSGRFDHIVQRVNLPVVSADHGGLSQGVVKLFKREALKKAALCYGQTDNECRMIEKYGGRSKLQPNGCDVSEFFPDPTAQRNKTVLTVTRLTDRQKRTSDLIRALAELPGEWTLDIAGTGPDKGMLEKLAVDLNLSSRIRFHGFVDHAKVREFLRRCGVYAMPSANEGLAVAALEAMACGAAVVLSQIRAFEPLVTDGVNGRLVPVGDVKGLAAGIMDAWKHHEALGSAASETVRTRYNTRVLYSELAKSLRDSIDRSSAYK
jgi:glycosyltransferase involved in cell wall biosynthesis